MDSIKIRVALADDVEILRRSMAAVLEQDSDIDVIGTAENGAGLIDICKENKPDVAVVDIRMPVMSGIEAAKWLRAHMPEIRILILTTFDNDDYIQELLSVGIDGYILKGCDDQSLIGAVKSVYMGINTLTPVILEKLGAMLKTGAKAGGFKPEPPDAAERDAAERETADAAEREAPDAAEREAADAAEREAANAAERETDELTPIEQKVAELIGKNYYNKDIASELNLTYGHVRNIVSRIYRKLGVSERDLVRKFVDREL